ncbi:hypothetical protein KDA_44590 [Dictyobacter alpinus]|uniref:Uncharacterized protein n=1 Tax=Dictyobacter alpinus TaxID=2014873 RepID=A0A402BC89_9CHLR|nr:hypothetical protein KDA_44590 [Dictyobacter alpinus]
MRGVPDRPLLSMYIVAVLLTRVSKTATKKDLTYTCKYSILEAQMNVKGKRMDTCNG